MKNLDRISIRIRLMWIFLSFIIFVVGLGIFVVNQMNQLGFITNEMYQHPLQVSSASEEACLGINKIHRNMKDLVFSDNELQLFKLMQEVKSLEEEVHKNLDIVHNKILGEEGKKLVQEARQMNIDWEQIRNEEIELVSNGRNKEAKLIAEGKATEHVKHLELKMNELSAYARNKADEFFMNANKIQQTNRRALVTLIIVISILGFTIYYLTVFSILKPIFALKSAMSNFTKTGKLIESTLEGKNEIVDMAKDYNLLVEKLKEQFWLKDGLNQINKELSGDNSLDELAEKAITFLSRYMDAGNGVFYLYKKEYQTLNLHASFAFTERDVFSNKYSLGNGTIGQVALDRKPILLKNIKKQEALVTTGTISAIPLNTYTFPLIYENELYGVIELASFESFNKLKQEFLLEASRIISTYLYTAIQNKQIKDLLRISEEAKEEAQEKAEALQKANEILEEQQQLLQQQAGEMQQSNAQLEEQQQQLQQQTEEMQKTNTILEEQHQQLEEQSNLLKMQNQNLMGAREELEKRTRELELSNSYKSEFLANMSHELRTPLNSIILLSKLLIRNENKGLNKKDLEKAYVINKSGNELLRLINDILDLSKIESGRMDLNITEFKSQELLMELKQFFNEIAQEKKLEFILDDIQNTKLVGDKDKISQILRNFLANAFKFTEQGSVVLKINLDKKKKNSVIFSVLDTGIGIPKEKQEEIFEAFRQVNGSISREFGGTGLGLTICKRLSELLDGNIEVKSEEGVGSEFSLIIPNVILNSEIINNQAELSQKLNIMSLKEVSASEDMKSFDKVILIIEDDEKFAHAIKEINANMGYDTLIALNGKDGLDLAKKHKIDGILLDLGLPDVSGIEVLKELKKAKELRRIPVHIISAWDKDIKVQKMGAIGYHQKPITEQEIINLISKMIAFSEKNPKKLLVVEDDEVQREAMKELIGNKVIEIQCIDTEEAAFRELSKGIYDAVILDLKLKKGNGINICKYIEEQKIEIPVIIYTGMDLTREQEYELKKYADSIIIKTVNSDERLLDEVTLFLHKVKKNGKTDHYLLSRTKEEYALSLKGKNILIVDDDIRNVFVLASALENYNSTIYDAENGVAALEMLKKHKVDLILMDIMMPVMNGYETIKEIRKDEKLSRIPIIALTANALKGDKQKCIEAGADDYISKPVDYDVLIRLVKAWISNTRG